MVAVVASFLYVAPVARSLAKKVAARMRYPRRVDEALLTNCLEARTYLKQALSGKYSFIDYNELIHKK